jgi:phosphatidylethanolamine-binding protein (PEBP) family uncharacterized protein
MAAAALLAASIVIHAPWLAGGAIPRRYTCDGADARPAITWTFDRRAAAYALEVVDVDAPGGRFVHWLELGPVQGRNSFGRIGWSGPCPPVGEKAHRYVTTVFALEREPRLATGFDDSQLRRAIRGHVIASASLLGRYGR